MKNLLLFISIFFASLNANANDLVISIADDLEISFGDEKLNFGRSEEVERDRSLESREKRENLKQYYYPNYRFSDDENSEGSWVKDGYTILRDNPSGEDEAKKMAAIKKSLIGVMGEEPYTELITRLDDRYTWVDVRYYSIRKDDEVQSACISVFWEMGISFAKVSDTINFCGRHILTEDQVIFEVNKFAHDYNVPIKEKLFSDEQVMDLLTIALYGLEAVYRNPKNFELLLKSAEEAQGEDL